MAELCAFRHPVMPAVVVASMSQRVLLPSSDVRGRMIFFYFLCNVYVYYTRGNDDDDDGDARTRMKRAAAARQGLQMV